MPPVTFRAQKLDGVPQARRRFLGCDGLSTSSGTKVWTREMEKAMGVALGVFLILLMIYALVRLVDWAF